MKKVMPSVKLQVAVYEENLKLGNQKSPLLPLHTKNV
jgi:hypothetical protein